ncbi:hypothetical protein I6F43_16050 [Pseudoalteromonas sp. NZS71_1]|uniref:hypothetical protein n=1 Tax=unclassified Pseudoalteromonas TaxID=194690 RepID=UPI0018CD3C3D|nr:MULTISPECIES: hypothetical protein [unclassified Pseudoalteromonas]MBH0018282.1 hypothetical protein [Pseudoalteromonas sp. NGC95]MBH0036156.1 hypothetical protein [Pseudoalteromonas sp. NZS71_1]
MIQQLKGKLTDITESHRQVTDKTTLNVYDYLEIDGVKYGNMQVPDVINRHLVHGIGEEFTFDYIELKERSTLKRTILGITTEAGKFDHISDVEIKPALTAMKVVFTMQLISFSLLWIIVGGVGSLITYFMTKSEDAGYLLFIGGFIGITTLAIRSNNKRLAPLHKVLEYVKERKQII